MITAPVAPRPFLFSAPPGARSAVPVTGAPAPLDRADVSTAPSEPLGMKGYLLAATSAFAVLASLAPTPAAAAPAVAEAATSRTHRRDDGGETHPLWGLIDRVEDAGRKLGTEVEKAGEAVKDAAPEPAKEGLRNARDTARQLDSVGRRGTIGDYGYSFDLIDADFDVNPRARLGGGGLQVGVKLETEADLFRSRLSKVEQTPGGWRVEKGLRGGLHLRHDLTAMAGGDSGTDSASRAELRAEAFQEWRGKWNGYDVRFEVSPGLGHDLLNGRTVAYARFEQGLDGGSFQFMDRNLSWTGEARQEYRHGFDGDSGYEYRIFGGVTHRFDTRLLGRKVDVEMKIGPEVRATDASPARVQPRVKFKVHY